MLKTILLIGDAILTGAVLVMLIIILVNLFFILLMVLLSFIAYLNVVYF